MTGPRFVLFGTPVRVEPIFFLVVVYFGLSLGSPALVAAWVGIVFVGILVHELGHAFAFRRYGSGAEITLWGFGGLTTGVAQPPRRSIIVSLAGPVTGLVVLGLPALALASSGAIADPTLARIVDMAVFVNVGWSLVNLLPVLPLDGGNITRDVLALVTGRPSERLARYISIGTAVAAGAAVWVIYDGRWLFPVLLAGLLALLNVAALRRGDADFIRIEEPPPAAATPGQGEQRGGHHPPDQSQQVLVDGYGALDRGDAAAAEVAARHVLETRPASAEVHQAAVELLAWAALRGRRPGEAAGALDALPRGRKASRYLRAAVEAATAVENQGGAAAVAARHPGDDPEGPVGKLVHAFLFAGESPAKIQAAGFVADWGLTETVTRGLLGAGADGTAEVLRLEDLLGRLGRLGDADRVRSLLLGDTQG